MPFTPRLIPAILPNLAHHVSMIQTAAIRTNKLLLNVIQNLPSPTDTSRPISEKPSQGTRAMPASPTPTANSSNLSQNQSTIRKDSVVSGRGDVSSPEDLDETPAPAPPPVPQPNAPLSQKSRGSTMQSGLSDMGPPLPPAGPSRPQSPMSAASVYGIAAVAQILPQPSQDEYDLFDYQATVNELTIQFLSEHEDTRVAALKWLIMLHQKAPKKVSILFLPALPCLILSVLVDFGHG